MNSPIRLLVLTTCYPLYPGHYNASYVLALCERLGRLGVEVTVLAPHAPGAPTDEVIEGVRVIRFRYLPPRWETLCYGGAAIPERVKKYWRYRLMLVPFMLAYITSAWRVARRVDCQLIHAHWILSVIVGWALKLTGKRVSLCAVSHGVEAFTAQRQPVLRGIVRWAFSRADRIYTFSEASRAALKTLGLSVSNIAIYPIGPDPALMAQIHETRLPEEREDAPTVLFVGRLVNRKGLPCLLGAFPEVVRRIPHAKLVIVGEGPERQRLQEQAQQLGLNGRIRFVQAPTAEQLAPWYRSCSVFVLPSVIDATGDTEGLGLVLLEALAFGKPIIGTRVGGIPEVIEDGKTGLLVPPGDSRALAEAIVSVLTDCSLAERLVANGRQLLEERYSWDAGAKRIYEDMSRWIGLAHRVDESAEACQLSR